MTDYPTLSEIDAYHAERANADWAAETDPNRAAYSLRARDWVNRSFMWDGERLDALQRDAWPRVGVYYEDGTERTDVPAEMLDAISIIADLYRLGFALDGNVDNSSGRIKRKKIDVLETEYDTRISPTKATVTQVTELLESAGLIMARNMLVRA